jgi:hypothetical protein
MREALLGHTRGARHNAVQLTQDIKETGDDHNSASGALEERFHPLEMVLWRIPKR